MTFFRRGARIAELGAPARPLSALPSRASRAMDLQRAAGNGAVAALMRQVLQRAATVSVPGDAHEHEADEVADQVMRMADPPSASPGPPAIQRMCAGCEDGSSDHVHRDSKEEGQVAPEHAEQAVQAAGRGGQPLPDTARRFFEPRFDSDFGHVRIHADGDAAHAARAVDARAYTVGSHIVFGAGEYSPQTHGGQRLLAHELTHVVQQTGPVQRARTEDEEDQAP